MSWQPRPERRFSGCKPHWGSGEGVVRQAEDEQHEPQRRPGRCRFWPHL